MSLKSEEEWIGRDETLPPDGPAWIRAIQADALRHAAEICRHQFQWHSNDCHNHDAKLLEAEAAKLEDKQ